MLKIFLSLCVLLFFLNSFSQDADSLDAVTVTATLSAQKTSNTARNITVINRKMIEKLPALSLQEILKLSGGIEIQQRGPVGSQADISARGSTFQQVLVLVDGIKVNDPITGHFSAYVPVVSSQIERIEILRGPAATIYGSEAVGGVINIITRLFSGKTKHKELELQAGAGDFGYWGTSLHLAGTKNKVSASIGFHNQKSEGWPIRNNAKAYFKNRLLSGGLRISPTKKITVALLSAFDSRDFAAQNYYTAFTSDNATEKVTTFYNHLNTSIQVGDHLFNIDGMLKATNDHYLFNAASVANNNKSMIGLLQATDQIKLNDQLTINAGISSELKKIQSNDRGNHHLSNLATFATGMYDAGGFILNGGIRLVNDNAGTHWVPQTGAVWKALVRERISIQMRANIGSAVRDADFTERYNNYNKDMVSGGRIGNPALVPERSVSYEAGIDVITTVTKFSAGLYRRNSNDLIDYMTTPYENMPRKINLSPTGAFSLATNVKEVRTTGFELDFFASKQFGKWSMSTSHHANFINNMVTKGEATLYILSAAKTVIQNNFLISHKKLNLSLSSIYKKRDNQSAPAIHAYLSPEYWLVNARASYAPISNLNFFVQIDNLGNKNYSDVLGAKMPGRWLSGGMNWKL